MSISPSYVQNFSSIVKNKILRDSTTGRRTTLFYSRPISKFDRPLSEKNLQQHFQSYAKMA